MANLNMGFYGVLLVEWRAKENNSYEASNTRKRINADPLSCLLLK